MNGTLVTVWFKFGDAYVSHDQFPDRYPEAEKVMMQFALECGKEKTRQDIDQMEKDLRDMERDLDRLAREKERYEQDIKKAEEAIRQAQASIEENVQAQGAAQEQIKQQQELIEATRRKLNDL